MQNETAINLVEAKFCASFLSRALCQSKAVVHHSILIGSASCISARQTYLLLNEWIKFQCQLRNSKEPIIIKKILTRGARELVGIALLLLVIGAIATRTNTTFEKH